MVLVALGVCLVSLAGAKLAVSSEKHVAFPTTFSTPASSSADFVPVSVKISRGPVGRTISFTHGGQAAATTRIGNSDQGLVGYRKPSVRRHVIVPTTPTRSFAKPKIVKNRRQGSIGGSGETNSNAGFAAGRP